MLAVHDVTAIQWPDQLPQNVASGPGLPTGAGTVQGTACGNSVAGSPRAEGFIDILVRSRWQEDE
jgi:hypothetical protein